MDTTRLGERHVMVKEQLEKRGIQNPWILQAMLDIPRHFFLPDEQHLKAYEDRPIPIGHGQSVSQPYLVAFMIELIEPDPSHRVLEVGLGSGYSASVLRRVVKEVYAIERDPLLLEETRRRLERLPFGQIHLRAGDGTLGWGEEAPFDSILVTAGSPRIPETLLSQLKVGGAMVVPVGSREEQKLVRVVKSSETHFQEKELMGVRFVPLVGAEGWPS